MKKLGVMLTLISGYFFFVQPNLVADCHRDIYGITYCAKYNGGGAIIKEPFIHVYCGRGECGQSKKGFWLCSRKQHGTVTVHDNGKVTCRGGCQPPSRKLCVAFKSNGYRFR